MSITLVYKTTLTTQACKLGEKGLSTNAVTISLLMQHVQADNVEHMYHVLENSHYQSKLNGTGNLESQ